MNEVKTETWTELAALLAALKDKYVELVELLKKKESTIIDGKETRLGAIVQQEQALVNEIEKMEERRIRAAQECLPGSEEPVTLKDILEIAPEDQREKLEKAAVELLEKMNEATAANRSVAELVRESMQFITYQLNLMGSEKTQDNVYQGNGRVKEESPKVRGIFNRQA